MAWIFLFGRLAFHRSPRVDLLLSGCSVMICELVFGIVCALSQVVTVLRRTIAQTPTVGGASAQTGQRKQKASGGSTKASSGKAAKAKTTA